MNEPWSLPPNWQWAQWASVARVVSNLVDPKGYQTMPHIAPNHIESGTGRLLPYRTVGEDEVVSPKHLFKPGQILYSKIRPYLAKVTIPDFAGLCSADMYPVETDLEPRYLKWWMLSSQFTRWTSERQARTVLPKINKHSLGLLPVPVAPIAEQRRIADLLEEHLSRLDAADRNLTRARGSARAMVRSSLSAGLRAKLLEDDLSEGAASEIIGSPTQFLAAPDDRLWPLPDTWAWARVGDIFQVNVGATPSRADATLWSGELPWVSSGEVAFSRISATKERIARAAAGNPETRIHPPGTVMLAMIGEGKTRGQAAVLGIEAAHNQNCASIRVAGTSILPEYIFGYLEERYLETRRGGSGGQQPALNKAAVQRFPVPIAPLGTQRRLVAAWDEARAAADRLNDELRRARQRSSRLRQSLLSAAFSGRLSATSDASDVVEATGA